MLRERTLRNAILLALIAVFSAGLGVAAGELPYSAIRGQPYGLISPNFAAGDQPGIVWIGLVVLLVIVVILVTILIRGLGPRHYGPHGAAGWAMVGFLFGALSQAGRLLLPARETSGSSLLANIFFGLLAVAIYLLVFHLLLPRFAPIDGLSEPRMEERDHV